jgi:hypothetical protein
MVIHLGTVAKEPKANHGIAGQERHLNMAHSPMDMAIRVIVDTTIKTKSESEKVELRATNDDEQDHNKAENPKPCIEDTQGRHAPNASRG